jgi:hypothetical protein
MIAKHINKKENKKEYKILANYAGAKQMHMLQKIM